MSDEYIVEVRKSNRWCDFDLLYKYGFSSYQSYYRWSGPRRMACKIERVMRRHGWTTKIYEKKYGRADNYRSVYFRNNPSANGIYHCVYCGKLLHKQDVQVDHVIPVGKVKSKGLPRLFLRGRGVNDARNLVASCSRCNYKKLDYIGLWPLRAFLGRHRSYFMIKRIILLFLLTIIIVGCIYLYKNPYVISQTLDKLFSQYAY